MLGDRRPWQAMDFFFSLQCSSPSAERHFRFPVVVTGVTTLSVEQCPAAPEDDGREKGRLSLSRPFGTARDVHVSQLRDTQRSGSSSFF